MSNVSFAADTAREAAILTIRRACPSAAADLGSLASDRLPWIKQQVRDGELKAEPIPAPAIKTGEIRNWRVARCWLDYAGQLLHDQRNPMVRRLVHVLQYASFAVPTKTRRLDDAKLMNSREHWRTWRRKRPDFFFDHAPSTQDIRQGDVSTAGSGLCATASWLPISESLVGTTSTNAHCSQDRRGNCQTPNIDQTCIPVCIVQHARTTDRRARSRNLQTADAVYGNDRILILVCAGRSSGLVRGRKYSRPGAALSRGFVAVALGLPANARLPSMMYIQSSSRWIVPKLCAACRLLASSTLGNTRLAARTRAASHLVCAVAQLLHSSGQPCTPVSLTDPAQMLYI